MTPFRASENVNQQAVYNNLHDKRKIYKRKIKLGVLVGAADIRKVFNKRDSTNWSSKPYTITEVIHDTIPSYRIDSIPERYNENILLRTKITLEENNQVMKNLILIQ